MSRPSSVPNHKRPKRSLRIVFTVLLESPSLVVKDVKFISCCELAVKMLATVNKCNRSVLFKLMV
jgi:hypothetical protein